MSKPPVKEGESYLVKIEDIGDSGEGIGKIDGFTVFIDDAVPGDKAIVNLDKVKKSYAKGRIVEFIEQSSYRIDPKCPIAKECGGCQIQYIDYEKQLDIKKNTVTSAIERIGKLENVIIHDIIGMEKPYRYRNKAQFPIGIDKESSIIGFYKKGTHDIVDTQGCKIQHEINDKIVKVMKKIIDEKGLSVYDEQTGKGLLRHILTRVSFSTGDIMLVIVTNGNELPYKDYITEELVKNLPKIKSIIHNINAKKTNKVLGFKCNTLYGDDKIIDYINDFKFEISPLSFFQVNPMQTEVLYEKALEYAKLNGNETVIDLYCGIGTISLFLANKAKKVYGIEIIDAAIEDAKRNAQINDINNAEFHVGKAEELMPKLYNDGVRPDVVVLDPPRKGCDEVVLKTIADMNPERIVYVSCKPSTLARDLKILDELGYRTVEVQPVDMFPHTTHVETVVLMSRVDK